MAENAVLPEDAALILPGFDGANPLGFLAALGSFRVLTIKSEHPPKMAWRPDRGIWKPCILSACNNIDDLAERLVSALDATAPEPWSLHQRLPFEANLLREAAISAVNCDSVMNRENVDAIAAFGVEAIRNEEGEFEDTSLRMIRSGDAAGNGLLAYGKRIREMTTKDDIRRAIGHRWLSKDESCAMRWDPSENRGYALQWTNPSKESAVSERGANRLALEAMPLLPTLPCKRGVETTAFGLPDGETEAFTWPIWNTYINLDVVRTMLSLSSLQDESPSRIELRELGIGAAYRAKRIMTSTYYRNFSPALRVA